MTGGRSRVKKKKGKNKKHRTAFCQSMKEKTGVGINTGKGMGERKMRVVDSTCSNCIYLSVGSMGENANKSIRLGGEGNDKSGINGQGVRTRLGETSRKYGKIEMTLH